MRSRQGSGECSRRGIIVEVTDDDGEITSIRIPCSATRFVEHAERDGCRAKIRPDRNRPAIVSTAMLSMSLVAVVSWTTGWHESSRRSSLDTGGRVNLATEYFWASTWGWELSPHRIVYDRDDDHQMGEIVARLRDRCDSVKNPF